ncbi:ATP-binding protein [Nocardioides sp.]|uniref:ATP-binding protein n=1 Tax=Nocardioides sp. TaxID=35761 RepID=UPI00356880AF
MPLNRPALTLGPGPRGVHAARRWVVRTCQDIGRADLVETAELGVSELVTNALLHGEPPITVRVRGTVEHPRVEVRDSSMEPPVLPAPDPDGEEPLLTFGRGLGILAHGSEAWGAEMEDDGKVVWFAPSAGFQQTSTTGLITGADAARATRTPAHDRVRVEILGVPLRLYLEFQGHFKELRREVRLLALAHEADYPLAKSLSDLFTTLDRHLREGIGVEQIEAAIAQNLTVTDLVVQMPRATARTLSRFIELLDLADDFCRQQRLLSLARSDEQRRFQTWFLCEFVRQAGNEEPLRWPEKDHPQHSVVS